MSALDINITRDGAKADVALIGRLDTNTAPEFETAADGLLSEGVNDITVDMSECVYVSSAGLRVIIALQKKLMAGGSLVFRGVQQDVKDVFDMTGFSSILTFED